MKNSKLFNLLLFTVLFAITHSCVKNDVEKDTLPDEVSEPDTSELEITQLQIPANFEFTTKQDITLTINDNEENIKYSVYAYQEPLVTGATESILNEEQIEESVPEIITDELNHFIFGGSPSFGTITHTFTLPTYYKKLYLRRKSGLVYSSVILSISSSSVTYDYQPPSTDITGKSNAVAIDILHCVNGAGEHFQVNPLTGDYTLISTMPMGSYTAAIDNTNKVLYSIGKSSPNPLMKYDMVSETWTTVGNVGKGGPRLDYNESDGLLYFSSKDKLYTIDPTNANIISTWVINGLHNTSGGDLASNAEGVIYLCSFSGLYRLDLDKNNEYQAIRISADNLPFSPTSMTFDSNNELWLANNTSNSDLIIMDTVTGGYEYRYGPNSTSGKTVDRTINDLTTFIDDDTEVVDEDSDGDGILDSQDEYPDDANKAFETYTPSKYGWGTLAFEDLWPFIGDYDFNDMVVNYRTVAILNSDNEAVQLDFHYEVTNDGAGFTNAFGIELENISPSQVSSVTGSTLTEGYINTASNGLEENQNNAVVIFYDNNGTQVGIPSVVSITFVEPISTSVLGSAPFNPFMIINKERNREVHLPNKPRTSLGLIDVNVNGINVDLDGNYLSNIRLPWAINIAHNFNPPTEKTPIDEAYNFFAQWATSGGTQLEDWYKDNPGYRNENKLKN